MTKDNFYIVSEKKKKYLVKRMVGGEQGSVSKVYTIDGDIEDLKGEEYNGKPFFRKLIPKVVDGEKNTKGYSEMFIADLLFKSPNPKLLRIYNVVNCDDTLMYYDAELLDTDRRAEVRGTFKKTEVQECIDELHRFNIVYIDLKLDNIGYSFVDKRTKVYDFDSSGICSIDGNVWIVEPPKWYAYKQALKIKHKLVEHTVNVDTTKYDFVNKMEIDSIMMKLLVI